MWFPSAVRRLIGAASTPAPSAIARRRSATSLSGASMAGGRLRSFRKAICVASAALSTEPVAARDSSNTSAE
jgi:hypothetical protein